LSSTAPDIDVIVLGAGAAGLMCAAECAKRGRRALVLDHWTTIGERIRVSGGGRCNFTNRHVSAGNYLSLNPHFCRSALARFQPSHVIAMVEQAGIGYEERDHGQLFCTTSAIAITKMLTGACTDAGARIVPNCTIGEVTALGAHQASEPASPTAPRFAVATSQGTFTTQSLVVATGGLAVPKLGATPLGYRLAEQFGIGIVAPKPALVPLALDSVGLSRLSALAGVAFAAEASCETPDAPRFREDALITHRGLSGPVILQVSSYWQQREYGGGSKGVITLDLMPGVDAAGWVREQRNMGGALANALCEYLSRRFASEWCALHHFDTPLHQMTRAELDRAANLLNAWPIRPAGTLGFDKAEVTLGGVDTTALSSQTMEAQSAPGLYFVGEVVDVTGWLGGFNFQWAWSSGWAAGQHA
jgi:predicted Rossmann fold flavoprotein